MRVKSAFTRLCAVMNEDLVPVLAASGFSTTDTPFRREQVRYEFRRPRAEGAEVIAVLFTRGRKALFYVQLYVEPPAGLPALAASGGDLQLAALSAAGVWWPIGVTPFRAVPTFLDRLRGHRGVDVARPVRQCAALLPHAERWFNDGTRSRHVVEGRLTLPARPLGPQE